MHRISILIAALALPLAGTAQALYNNGATLNISSSTTVYVVGDLTNATGSTINNSGTLNVSGNTLNNGTLTAPSGSNLTLNGSAAQTLSGTSPVVAKDVVVNNAAGITLATPLQVDGAMTFTSGLVTATNASYPVVFTANGSVSGTPTDASHVDGYVQKGGTGSFTYPVGNASKYQPVGINLSANSAGMTARYFGSDPGAATFGTGGSSSTPLVAVNRKEYWDLTPAGTATGAVTIYFDSYNNTGIANTADLRVAHLSGGQWLNEGATSVSGTTANGSVTGNSISTFSPFTLGSISTASPLPLTLLAFTGRGDGGANRLDWATAMEDAGATTFSVERSANGSSFTALQDVAGKGSNSQYIAYDRQPLAGVSYYRLRITEGSASRFSQIISLRRNAGEGANAIAVYPQPATAELTINCTAGSLGNTVATMLDAQGRVITQFGLSTGNTILDVHSWPAGIYTLRLADGSAHKIVKQ